MESTGSRAEMVADFKTTLDSWNKLHGMSDVTLLKSYVLMILIHDLFLSWLRRVDNVKLGDLIGKGRDINPLIIIKGNFGEVFVGTWRNWKIAAKRAIESTNPEKNKQNELDFYKEGFILQYEGYTS